MRTAGRTMRLLLLLLLLSSKRATELGHYNSHIPHTCRDLRPHQNPLMYPRMHPGPSMLVLRWRRVSRRSTTALSAPCCVVCATMLSLALWLTACCICSIHTCMHTCMHTYTHTIHTRDTTKSQQRDNRETTESMVPSDTQ